jgi:flagellin
MPITLNTNLASLQAQRALSNNNKALGQTLERLSTGLRINHGSDDPSGLFSASQLSAEQTGIQSALGNAQRAGNIVGTAEGGLNEIANQLTALQDLVKTASNTGGQSADEIAASQAQADALLSQVNRIAGATTFEGKKLLNGALDYSASGVAAANILNLRVNSARFTGAAPVAVNVNVVTSALTAKVGYAGGALAAANTVNLEIAGNTGSDQVTIAGGATVANIIAAVNTVKATTGISAAASGANLRFDSTTFGSDQFVSVKTISGIFVPTANRAVGKDAVVTVNNVAASARGKDITLRTATLDTQFTLSTAFNIAGSASTFNVVGGGATFALGSKVTDANKVSLGIQSVTTANLGDATNGVLATLGSGGANALTTANLSTSQAIIDSAIKQISTLQGRLGAFQKYSVNGTVNALQTTLQNVTSANSDLTSADFAAETANLSRQQVLASAGASVLATANSQSQSVLALLR